MERVKDALLRMVPLVFLEADRSACLFTDVRDAHWGTVVAQIPPDEPLAYYGVARSIASCEVNYGSSDTHTLPPALIGDPLLHFLSEWRSTSRSPAVDPPTTVQPLNRPAAIC
jgi:hypothetical protein